MTALQRALAVLSITEIIAYGASLYAFGLTAPLIAAEMGWSKPFVYAGFSLSIVCSGVAAPFVGRAVDRRGGRAVMAAGSLVTAAAFLLFALTRNEATFLLGCAMVGLGMAMTTYDAAFATLAWLNAAKARRAITILTLAGGFASTLFWPLTQFIITTAGWREAYFVYAAIQFIICAPLHAFGLPKTPATPDPVAATDKPRETRHEPLTRSARALAFLLFAATLVSYGFVSNGVAVHLFPALDALGAERSVAVMIATLFGPAQVAARLADLLLGRLATPALLGAVAFGALPASLIILLVAPFGLPTLIAFALLYGAGNGLTTIARGVIPLALFGREGYGAMLGLLSAPSLLAMASAPPVLAFVSSVADVRAMLWVCAGFATLAFLSMASLILRFGDRLRA